MIEYFRRLKFFKNKFYGKSDDLILSYYIPIELKKVPSLFQCITDYDLFQAYIFKNKFYKKNYSLNMCADTLKEIFDVKSISTDLFDYCEPDETCPMIDNEIESLSVDCELEIESLQQSISEKKEAISNLEAQAEESIEKTENLLENEISSLESDIASMWGKVEEYQSTMETIQSELESMRESCYYTRKEGRYNRNAFYEYLGSITISNGKLIADNDYMEEFKKERYTESYSYDSQVYSDSLDNLECIEAWASQWTDPSYLDEIFGHFDFIVGNTELEEIKPTLLNQTLNFLSFAKTKFLNDLAIHKKK